MRQQRNIQDLVFRSNKCQVYDLALWQIGLFEIRVFYWDITGDYSVEEPLVCNTKMLRPCSLVSKLDIPSGIWRADTYSSRAVAHSHSSVAKLSNSSDLEPPILLLEAKAVVLFS